MITDEQRAKHRETQRKYAQSQKGKARRRVYMRSYMRVRRAGEQRKRAEAEAKIVASINWRTEMTPEAKPSTEPLWKAAPIDPYDPAPENEPGPQFIMPTYSAAIERLRNTAGDKWTPVE
jgi:hypothetical protein